ncbi:MAG: ABC transporter ATP-binding protein [Planctomycetota bacterium]|nr:ABC transporter ATP-binding protein [Planctomycetota bacterium]
MDAIVLESVTCGYGRSEVLRDVSLAVSAGEFVGLVGPNGCGKTTLLRAATGIIPCTRGRVLVNGTDVRALSSRELARRIAVVSQEVQMDLAFSVEEVAMMGRTPHLTLAGRRNAHDAEVVARALDLVDVKHLADRPVRELSLGERQRVFIAMALAQEAGLFLLDEPTTHLDIGHQVSALDIFRKLNREREMTVVAVLHDLNLASMYCDRVVLLSEGRIRAAGTPHEVLTYQNIEAVYKTVVVVREEPVTGRPHVFLVPKDRWTPRAPA